MAKNFKDKIPNLKNTYENMKTIKNIFTDPLFCCSLIAAIATLVLGRPNFKEINWSTIGSLFSLMLTVQTLQFLNVFKFIAMKLTNLVKNSRQLIQLLIALAFFSSMLLTNDVAIITLIPLLSLSIKNLKVAPELPVILICLAANLGSILLPIGNPQNLFLFFNYQLNFNQFIKLSFPLWLISLIVCEALSFFINPIKILPQKEPLPVFKQWQLIISSFSAIIVLLSGLKLIPLLIGIIIAIFTSLIISPKIFKSIDYALLLTFLCFFIAVNNLSQAKFIKYFLKKIDNYQLGVYLSSLGLSQCLSNVPTAILWSPFTDQVPALFYGTNIGGLGTLIASLANLLAFKQYQINFQPKKHKYLKQFSLINFGLLLIYGLLGVIMLH